MLCSKLIKLLALPTLSAATPRLLPRAECHDYVPINTRGTGEQQGTSIGFRAMLNQILAAVPGGSVYDTHYLAAPDATQLTVKIGSDDVIRFINEGLASCPEQRYALFGYSQGATVTNQVLQNLTTTSPRGQQIKSIVTIGNPNHLPNKQGNADENCGTSTAGATGILNPTADFSIPDVWYATGKVRDICFSDDQVCNGVSLGNIFSGEHLLYGFSESVQSCGAEFVIPKISQ
ncbi:hypothetical protein MBLNU13_g01547t1 [Cladosporium sp. NU13]